MRPDPHTSVFSCAAPAKINLALHVTGQRADGYHHLDSLVVFAGPGDAVSLELVSPDNPDNPAGPHLALSGPFCGGLDTGADNLVLKAWRAVADRLGIDPALAPLWSLEKNLPIASGIGGGSADGAAVLLCARAYARTFREQEISLAELSELAQALGADLPMCLHSSPLIARGIGEDIELLEDFPELDMVLVNPLKAIATPQVFAKLTNKQNPPLAPLPARLTPAILADWLLDQRNDLQCAASGLVHEIGEIIDILEASGAMLARMSGSGATCFGLYADANAAQTAAAAISSAHPDWWVKAARSSAFGIDRCRRI